MDRYEVFTEGYESKFFCDKKRNFSRIENDY